LADCARNGTVIIKQIFAYLEEELKAELRKDLRSLIEEKVNLLNSKIEEVESSLEDFLNLQIYGSGGLAR